MSEILFLFILISLVSCHNWVASESRSPIANTFNPCLPRVNEAPHIQVGPDQKFQVEWQTGHLNRKTYLVLLKAEDADKLAVHEPNMLNQYIDGAPEGANKMTDVENGHQKVHRRAGMSLVMNGDSTTSPEKTFSEWINGSHPLYFERPAEWGGSLNTFLYDQADIEGDISVAYHNDNWPWILEVRRYVHAQHMPSERDAAQFQIPAGSDFGDYIIHYVWGGYRDCVDINYIDQEVEFIYGEALGEDVWTKFDHCFFERPRRVFRAMMEMFTPEPEYCMRECAKVAACSGVQVYPLFPKGIYSGYSSFMDDKFWNNPAVNGSANGFRKYSADDEIETYVCYWLTPRARTDTINEYEISLDPENPFFHGTCYYRSQPRTFLNVDTGTPMESNSQWKFHKGCLDCQDKARNDRSEFSAAAKKLNIHFDQCQDCDLEPVEYVPPVTASLIRMNADCDGRRNNPGTSHHNCTEVAAGMCHKQLQVIGRNTEVLKSECAAMAAKDSDCGNYFSMHRNGGYNNCHCLRNIECCLTCSTVSFSNWDVYEIIPSQADPTCATGVSNGDACCSASCGAECLPNTGYINSPGQCCSTCITRSCNEFGPPCMMNQ